REGRIKAQEKKQCQTLHFQQVKRARVGQKTQDGERFRFMEEKSIIKTGPCVGEHGNDKIKLRPCKHTQDRHRIWPVSAHQHQKNNADDNTRVGNKETEEANVRKPEVEIR